MMYFILCSITFINAQSKFNLSFGGGYILNFYNTEYTDYWGEGYFINLSSEYFIFNDISIFCNSSFQNHFFNASLYKLSHKFIDEGVHLVDGKSREISDISLGFRFYDSLSIFKPFVSVGAGILLLAPGKIFLKTGIDNSGNNMNITESVYKGFSFSQFTMGIGSEILLTNNIKIIIEGKILETFKRGPSYIPIFTSIKIGF